MQSIDSVSGHKRRSDATIDQTVEKRIKRPTLDRDTLSVVFSYLSLQSKLRALSTCRAWKHVLETMPRLEIELIGPHAQMASRSTFYVRHVTALHLETTHQLDEVLCTSRHFPHLHYLAITVTLSQVNLTDGNEFPRGLTSLALSMDDSNCNSQPEYNRCIATVHHILDKAASLAHLTRLGITGPLRFDIPPTFAWEPLRRMVGLRRFQSTYINWQPHHMDIFRSLPRLQFLSFRVVVPTKKDLTRALCAIPAPKELQVFDSNIPLTDETAGYLQHLSSLTILQPRSFFVSDASFLHRLPLLQSINIVPPFHFGFEPDPLFPEEDAGYLDRIGLISSLPLGLHTLTLVSKFLTDTHLTHLLTRLVHLTSLDVSMQSITTLACFRSAVSMEKLSLRSPTCLATQWECLFPMKRLRSLKLSGVPRDPKLKQRLDESKAHWPLLCEFAYSN